MMTQLTFNKNQTFLLISIGLFILFGISCSSSDEEVCQDCLTENLTRSITNEYFRYNEQIDATLIDKDYYLNDFQNRYSVCKPEILETYNDKVLKISGFVSSPCNPEDRDIITIETFEVIDYCFNPIPESNELFDLFNDWVFYSIETADTTLFVPCDFVYPIGVRFSEEKFNNIPEDYPYSFHITSSYSSQGNCNITNDKIYLGSGIIIDTFPWLATDALKNWDNEFSNLFTNDSGMEEAILTYEINNNVLTLSNPLTSIKAILYIGAN